MCRPHHTEDAMMGSTFVMMGSFSIVSGFLTIAAHGIGWWWLLAGAGMVVGALFVVFGGKMALRGIADMVYKPKVLAAWTPTQGWTYPEDSRRFSD